MPEYSFREIMVLVAAREIRDEDIVFCGTGISMVAAMAAKHISAPHSIIFFETGGIDSQLLELPLSVGDPRVMFGTSINAGLADSFGILQNPFTGPRVVGIFGAAQIDRHGNLNTTCIGDYWRPQVRFPGCGGACDAASYAGRSIIFMKQEKRKFVEKVDYLSTPGWIPGPGGRKEAGLPERGPSMVITDMGVMRFDDDSKHMYLSRTYPGILPQQVQDEMDIEIDLSRAVEEKPPTEEELSLLRERIDPQGLII
ncbi:MAG: CoA-transferase subunit beta [Thermodesulfobacteriota bacterium]